MTPWQARRLYWNRSSWELKPTDDLSGDAKLDVDAYDPLLGMSYGELAADSRSMHKSQGFGVARSRAPIVEHFKLLADDGVREAQQRAPSAACWTGSTSAGAACRAARACGRSSTRRFTRFNPAAPAASIPALAAIDAALDGVGDAGWRAQKKREVRDLILACAGVFAEATAPDFRVAPGTAVDDRRHRRQPLAGGRRRWRPCASR